MTSENDTAEPLILVGVDGSPASLRALSWAMRQAVLTGAVLEIVATWEWPSSYGSAGWGGVMPSDYDPEGDTRQMVEEIATSLQVAYPIVDVRTKVVEGHPAPVLTELSRQADLLVLGNRGHGAFAGMLVGSVSDHCVAHARCPVVVVHDEHDEGA